MDRVSSQFNVDSTHSDILPPVKQLLSYFNFATDGAIPSLHSLNQICGQMQINELHFIEDSALADSGLYYEEFIAETGHIPTRSNWHDAFNAMIWLQFPKTKRLLNKLHMEDINEFGVHPRTRRRNHLTHFDECGVILAIPRSQYPHGQAVISALAKHHWEVAFVEHSEYWGEAIFPILFGHANLEMLLNPYIGLTGKWLALIVEDEFVSADWFTRCQYLDEALVSRIEQLEYFQAKGLLLPLPLLGVPGWYESQSPAFYANTDYFRPRRQGSAISPLLTQLL